MLRIVRIQVELCFGDEVQSEEVTLVQVELWETRFSPKMSPSNSDLSKPCETPYGKVAAIRQAAMLIYFLVLKTVCCGYKKNSRRRFSSVP